MRTTLILLFVFACAEMYSQDLVITEIMYNSPTEDRQFVELYNKGDDSLNLDGYRFVESIRLVFPPLILPPGELLVLTRDACNFEEIFEPDFDYLEWDLGSMNTQGDSIVLINPENDTIINIEFDDNLPWPPLGKRLGRSIQLCDLESDMTDPANWQSSDSKTSINIFPQGNFLHASPGELTDCPSSYNFLAGTQSVIVEREVQRLFDIHLETSSLDTQYFVVKSNGKATEGFDYILKSDTIYFPPGQSLARIRTDLFEDQAVEKIEDICFDVYDIQFDTLYTCLKSALILDDDGPLEKNIEIRGVIDGEDFDAVELYLKQDIAGTGFPRYGLSIERNGDTDRIQDLTFFSPNQSKGSCIFISSDTVRFKKFFGEPDAPLLYDGGLTFNGSDVIVLYENAVPIDVFGQLGESGLGTAWEHRDGWAKKISVGNDTIFTIDNWEFSGLDVLEGETNETSQVPYSLDCYPSAVPHQSRTTAINIYPNPSQGSITVSADDVIDKINVVDLMGQSVFSSFDKTRIQTIDIPKGIKGVLLLEIEIQGNKEVRKIVIE